MDPASADVPREPPRPSHGRVKRCHIPGVALQTPPFATSWRSSARMISLAAATPSTAAGRMTSSTGSRSGAAKHGAVTRTGTSLGTVRLPGRFAVLGERDYRLFYIGQVVTL